MTVIYAKRTILSDSLLSWTAAQPSDSGLGIKEKKRLAFVMYAIILFKRLFAVIMYARSFVKRSRYM